MALPGNDYVVLSGDTFAESSGENWLETLRRWLVQCPQCSEVRLVVGIHETDRYVCKDCGHDFAIKLSLASKGKRDKKS